MKKNTFKYGFCLWLAIGLLSGSYAFAHHDLGNHKSRTTWDVLEKRMGNQELNFRFSPVDLSFWKTDANTSTAGLRAKSSVPNMRKIISIRMLDEFEINTVFQEMDNMWLDYQKFEYAQKALYVKNITTKQAKEIIGRLTYEELKLELAKYAYHRVVDRGEYNSVKELLTFNSAKNELERYIKDH